MVTSWFVLVNLTVLLVSVNASPLLGRRKLLFRNDGEDVPSRYGSDPFQEQTRILQWPTFEPRPAYMNELRGLDKYIPPPTDGVNGLDPASQLQQVPVGRGGALDSVSQLQPAPVGRGGALDSASQLQQVPVGRGGALDSPSQLQQAAVGRGGALDSPSQLQQSPVGRGGALDSPSLSLQAPVAMGKGETFDLLNQLQQQGMGRGGETFDLANQLQQAVEWGPPILPPDFMNSRMGYLSPIFTRSKDGVLGLDYASQLQQALSGGMQPLIGQLDQRTNGLFGVPNSFMGRSLDLSGIDFGRLFKEAIAGERNSEVLNRLKKLEEGLEVPPQTQASPNVFTGQRYLGF